MMMYAQDSDSFYKLNHPELLACFRSLGVNDRDDLHDYSQQFYLQLPNTLRLYDPKKSKFSSYIFECVKNLISLNKRNRHNTHSFTPYEDNILSSDDSLEFEVRIEDYKRFCIQTGSTSTLKVLDEVTSMLQDHRGFTGVSYATYYQYSERFLQAESI